MRPTLEPLESRHLPSAGLDLGGGLLFVRGDDSGNALLVSADPSGRIRVSDRGAEVPVYGLTPFVQNTAIVAVQAGAGVANVLAVDPSLGQLPVWLDGRAGGDTLFAYAPGSAVTESAGTGRVFHQAFAPAPVAVAVSPSDEGPVSLALDALAGQFGVANPDPRTRAQEAQDALQQALFTEQLLALFGAQP